MVKNTGGAVTSDTAGTKGGSVVVHRTVRTSQNDIFFREFA